MKYFHLLFFMFSFCGMYSQNLHNQSNAASITNEANTTTGWVGAGNITSSSNNPHSGNFSLSVSRTGVNGRDAGYTFNAVIGQIYTISIWARLGDSNFQPAFANWVGLNGFNTTLINSNNWTEYTWTVTATNSNPQIRVYAAPYSGGQIGNEVLLDNVNIQLLDETPPSIPAGLVSSNITSNSLDLSWSVSTDNVGVTDYEVFMDGISQGLSSGLLTQSITGLSPNTSYSFTVLAVDGSGNRSGQSTGLTVTTLELLDEVPPSIPTGLVSSNITSNSLDLSWSASTDNVGVTDYEVFMDGISQGLSSGLLTQSITGLSPNTSYSFTVLAVDGSGNRSGQSTGLTVATLELLDETPPSIPIGLVSSNITSNSLDLSWSASTDNVGVTDYEVFMDGISQGLSGGLLTQSITGLSPNTSYSFTVLAVDGSGNRSGQSTGLTVATLELLDETPPSIPTGLVSSNITSNSLDLIWSASTDNVGVTDYEVFMDGISQGLSSGLLTQSITGLSPNTSYSFTVLAVDGSGNRSGQSTGLTVATLELLDETPPSIPIGLVSSNITSNSLDLSWSASTDNVGVTDYEVFMDGISQGLSGGLLTQSITGLSPNTSYSFTVLAVDGSGNRSGQSTGLTVATLELLDETPPSIPTGLVSSNITSNSLDLIWTASTDNVGVTDYEVFMDGISQGLSGGLLTQSITGLSPNTSYSFTVLAVDGSGNRSGQSTGLTVMTLGNEINYTNLNANLSTVDWVARNLFSAGNIGIGTENTEGYRLAVAGNVVAEEIKVALQTSWPDYVFERTYNLPTLEEVYRHIKEKGHLINVPSASEVAKRGIRLGEMNAVLLEKIEELTLYILQQEKRISKLERALKTSGKK
ncbi:fibronectin type III domain-containing protein [Formosa haliotis]|uniref:fibronectin type III domain-containing protein n=1 Tax=Formosa haliotis TaxID=1555194 RepID=UPI0008270B3C|nr:fibronectin type III domain-containing protein [Formosa haliotis]